MQSLGLSVWRMKWMVFVPDGMWGRTPLARRPISFAAALIHLTLSGPSLSCAYSRDAPVAGSMTAWAVQYACTGKTVVWASKLATVAW